MKDKLRSLLRFLRKPRVLVLIGVAAALITGAILLYIEWDARRPMDFSIPEPVATLDTPTSEPATTAMPTDLPTRASPTLTPNVDATPTAAATPETSKAPTSGASSSAKPVSLKEDEVVVLLFSGKKIVVKRGVDETTLKKHVGWMETSAAPDGDCTYTVYAMDIIDKDTPAQIPATTSSELMILTCYPFYYSGSAPQQIVIMARR